MCRLSQTCNVNEQVNGFLKLTSVTKRHSYSSRWLTTLPPPAHLSLSLTAAIMAKLSPHSKPSAAPLSTSLVCTDEYHCTSCGILRTNALFFKSKGLTKCKIHLVACHDPSYLGLCKCIRAGWRGLCAIDLEDVPRTTPTAAQVRSIRREVEFLNSLPSRCKDAPLHLSVVTEEAVQSSATSYKVSFPLSIIRQHFALSPYHHYHAQSFD
jgi:hypothetical protein